MIHNVSGSEVSSSGESRTGYRAALDQSVTEISASVESYSDEFGQFITEISESIELGCVFGRFTQTGSDSSESIEYAGTVNHPYLPPDDGGIGDQPGYDFNIIHIVGATEMADSLESYTLSRNGFPVIVSYACKPVVYVFYNPLTEAQYNPLSEEDYNLMEE